MQNSGNSNILLIWIKALRVHQWLKNLILFLPILLSHKLSNWNIDLRVILAFLAFWNYEIEPLILADITAMLSIGTNYREWFKVLPLPEDFRKHFVNPYGDLVGLYYIYLNWKEDMIPKKYIEYLNLSMFKRIDVESARHLSSPTVTKSSVCILEVAPKFKVRLDMWKNIMAVLTQIYGDQTLARKNLPMDRINKSGNHFYDFKSSEKVIYLNKITSSTFGKTSSVSYDNFLNAELIKS